MSEEFINVNDNFIQILKPFRYIDVIFCTQTYNIYGNKVVSISKRNIISLILMNFFLIISFCISISITCFENESVKALFFYVNFLYIVLFALTSVGNVYFNKTVFTLLTYLKKIKRHTINPKDIFKLKVWAWTSCLLLIFFYIAAFVLKISQEDSFWIRHFIILVGIVLEMKLLSIACLVHLLAMILETWTNKALICKNVRGYKQRQSALNELKSTFQKLFVAYDLIKKSSNYLVFYQLIMSFFQLLMYITVIVDKLKNSQGSRFEFTIHAARCILWFFQGWTVQSFLGFSFETFYAEIASTRVKIFNNVCTEVDEKEFKQFGKGIVRSIDKGFSKMVACGLLTVDMNLPVCFWNLAANYIVFLLTFSL